MKIIINADMIASVFNSDRPTVAEILDNSVVKAMTKNCEVLDVYIDTMNANNLDNLVIRVIPSLKGKNKNG